MHIQEAPSQANNTLGSLKSNLGTIVDEYGESMRYHASLRATLMQTLDREEREARESIETAMKQLELVQTLRRDLLAGQVERHEAPAPNMEASVWNWFQEGAKNKYVPRSRTPDSIVSRPPSSAPVPELEEAAESQDTIREPEFNYLAMKNDSSDERPASPTEAQESVGNEGQSISASLATSLGSLTSSLRSRDDGVSRQLIGVVREAGAFTSPFVTVNRESLATLLNAFDHILLHGSLE